MALQKHNKSSSCSALDQKDPFGLDGVKNPRDLSDWKPKKENKNDIKNAKFLSKNQDSQKINFIDKAIDVLNKDKTVSESKKPLGFELKGTVKNPKRFNPQNVIGSNNRVVSAGIGSITDNNGPKKQIGSETNNSIWEPDKLGKMSGQKSNDEKTKDAKKEIDKIRKGMKQSRLDEMVDNLQQTDIRNDSTIRSSSPHMERSSMKPAMKNHISLFDQTEGKNDFDRIPEKTAGENLQENKDRKTHKDTSWRGLKTPTSTKKVVSRMFDILTETEKKT